MALKHKQVQEMHQKYTFNKKEVRRIFLHLSVSQSYVTLPRKATLRYLVKQVCFVGHRYIKNRGRLSCRTFVTLTTL